MRILLVNHAPLEGSGSGTTTAELGQALTRAGHDVRCLLVAERAVHEAPFPVRAVVCSGRAPQAELPFDFPAWTYHAASGNTYADLTDEQLDRYREVLRRELDRQVAEFDPQVIHCQHTGPLAHLALESGVPYLMTAHAASLRVALDDLRLRPLAEQAAENAAAVIAASEHLAAVVRRSLEGVDVRVEVVQPELSGGSFQAEPARLLDHESPCVVFAGTLVPRHGAATLLNAAAICESLHPTLRVNIIGGGPQAEELRQQAERLELWRTQFLGTQPRDVCRAMFSTAQLVVVPSHEGASTWTLLEALAGGTPVVASTGDGREELLAPEGGALIPPDDHELLAEVILRAVAEDWKAKQGLLLSQRSVASREATRWVQETVALYEQAIRARGGRA